VQRPHFEGRVFIIHDTNTVHVQAFETAKGTVAGASIKGLAPYFDHLTPRRILLRYSLFITHSILLPIMSPVFSHIDILSVVSFVSVVVVGKQGSLNQ
jgi:hypothetical protein